MKTLKNYSKILIIITLFIISESLLISCKPKPLNGKGSRYIQIEPKSKKENLQKTKEKTNTGRIKIIENFKIDCSCNITDINIIEIDGQEYIYVRNGTITPLKKYPKNYGFYLGNDTTE
jgi:hypothetical protein